MCRLRTSQKYPRTTSWATGRNCPRSFSLDLVGFYTHYDDLRVLAPVSKSLVLGTQPYVLADYSFANFGKAHSEGGEIALNYHPVSRWKIAASYSYLSLHQALTEQAPVGTSLSTFNDAPSHQVKLQSYLNLSKSLEFDTHFFYSNGFPTSLYPVYVTVPEHVRVDLRLGWRVNPRWELSVVGQDLFSSRHSELMSEMLNPDTYTGRDFYVRSEFRF